MNSGIIGKPDSVKGKTAVDWKTSAWKKIREKYPPLPKNSKNFAFPRTGYLPIFDGAHLRRSILWFLQNAHKYYVKGSIADRDLRLISHNIKKRAKQLNVPIPDNFDEQLKPDTFVMS